jgi:penicillin amidase
MVRYPIRKHNVIGGAYPKKGNLAENAWLGFVSPSELPFVINPDKGYIVNSNNMITSENVQHGISHGFGYQHRILRINEMLEAKLANKISVKDCMNIATDVLDI